MPEILDLLRGIEPHEQRDVLAPAVAARDRTGELRARREAARDARDVEELAAVERQRLAGGAFRELQRQHAHADQVGAMDAFERFGQYRLDAELARPFRRPVSRGAGAVF